MKRNLLCSIAFFCTLFASSQTSVNLSWLGAIGSTLTSGTEKFERSAIDAAGNVYITGQLSDYTDLDPGPGVQYYYGNSSTFIAKYSAAGTLLWANYMAGSAQTIGKAIAVDASGNVYLAGTMTGSTADMDPGATNFPLSIVGSYDMFLCSYNSSGVFQWAKGIGGPGASVKPSCIKVDATGAIYVGGHVAATSTVEFNAPGPSFTLGTNGGSTDAFLVKYNNTGNYAWGFTMGDFLSDYVYDMELDASNNVYIVGEFQTSINMDPAAPTTTVPSAGAQDGYFAKYTSGGAYIWGQTIGGILADGFYRIKNHAGNIAVSGYMSSTVMDADPGAGTFNLNKVGSGPVDLVLGKYSASSGSLMWAQNSGGTDMVHAYDMATDVQNNIYLAGGFTGDTDFDLSTAGSFTVPVTTFGYNDIFIAKYDDSGNFIYAKTSGFPGNDNSILGICVNSTNDIYVSGIHTNNLDVDFNATNTLTTYGADDIFLVKYNQCIDASTPTIAVVAQTMCANGVATLSLAGGQLNSATTWVWSGLACGSATFGTGTSVTVSPLFQTDYFVRGEGGCTNPGPCASATVAVNPSKNITGTVASSSVAVPGLVQLFRYEGLLTKWDSVTYQLVNAGGGYTFTSVNSGSYIIMCIPTSTAYVKTYAPNNSTWKNSTIFSHGCTNIYTINIDVVPIMTLTPGPGVLSGKIIEGTNYGGRNAEHTSVPGNPIGGLTIKGGRNPGGNVVAQGRTDGAGQYTLSGLPVSGPGETYFVFVDIPGVDTSGTHHIAISSTLTTYTDLDFVVDSDYVKPVDYTGVKELKLAGEKVKVFPNPARDLVHIQLDAKNESDISLELYDLFGKRIMNENYRSIQGEFKTDLNLGKLSRGVYFVKLKLNSGETRIKLVLSE